MALSGQLEVALASVNRTKNVLKMCDEHQTVNIIEPILQGSGE